ncbi:MAG: PIN domain-containing protein [Leptospirales bacterium]|nr:PIN domain-containing protein [Leptospirales bacterium]
MLKRVLIDAGPIISLFDKDDKYHRIIINFLKEKRYKFITTTAVLTEVSYMLNFNVEVQISFFEWVMKEGVILYEIDQKDIARIIELTKKYKDIPMDFADATLMIVAEKSGIKEIISLDSDFNIYRLPGKVVIKNIFNKNGARF